MGSVAGFASWGLEKTSRWWEVRKNSKVVAIETGTRQLT